MTNITASEILMKEYKCQTEPCPAHNCEECGYYKTKDEQIEALLFASKALEVKALVIAAKARGEIEKKEKIENTIANWLPSALETIRSGVADRLSKDGVTAYRVKNIIRIDIKEEE